jgi:ribulose-phosphate 3-epimerase
MSVYPGFGGQAYIEGSEEKLKELAHLRTLHTAAPLLEIDGGINEKTAALALEAGADILVAGNAIFGESDPVFAMEKIRNAASLS